MRGTIAFNSGFRSVIFAFAAIFGLAGVANADCFVKYGQAMDKAERIKATQIPLSTGTQFTKLDRHIRSGTSLSQFVSAVSSEKRFRRLAPVYRLLYQNGRWGGGETQKIEFMSLVKQGEPALENLTTFELALALKEANARERFCSGSPESFPDLIGVAREVRKYILNESRVANARSHSIATSRRPREANRSPGFSPQPVSSSASRAQ